MSHKLLAVNAEGYRIGESHHRAKLTDDDVETILYLRDAGLSYAQIAAKFDDDDLTVSKSTVRDICLGRIRAQYADRYRPARRADNDD